LDLIISSSVNKSNMLTHELNYILLLNYEPERQKKNTEKIILGLQICAIGK
jgi:hypothetical protein